MTILPVLRKRGLRQRVRDLAGLYESSRVSRARPLTCFRVIGVPFELLDPIRPETFDAARERWIKTVTDARERGDVNLEKAVNVAWQHLKNWKCAVCGGLKNRTRAQTCGSICGRKLSVNAIRKQNGAIVLRWDGQRYQNKMQEVEARAKFSILRETLARNGGNVSATARELRLSRNTCQYYIRKFGGLSQGLPWKQGD